MKKILSTLLILIIILSLPIVFIKTQEQEFVKVSIDGKKIYFDVPPKIVNGRTLVPFCAVFEALGTEPVWEEEIRTVTAKKGNTTVVLFISSKYATVNDNQVELDVPAAIINDRIFVPVRFIAESFGATVGWNGVTRIVKIKSKEQQIIQFDIERFEEQFEELEELFRKGGVE